MYSEEERAAKFKAICERISEGLLSLRKALKSVGISSETFYNWVDNNEEWARQYARACELRQEGLFEEIIEIADEQGDDIGVSKDGKEYVKHNVIQRNRLQVDARKWALSKMNPRKYGDKLDLTSDNKPIDKTVAVEIVPPKPLDE